MNISQNIGKEAVCTIVTKSHLNYAVALHRSIKRFMPGIQMHALVTNLEQGDDFGDYSNFTFYSNEDLNQTGIAAEIYKKYHGNNMDHYRWSCKPVFMTHLLKNGVDHVIYLDSDLFFFNDPAFLFSELAKSSVLLSPHFRTSDPAVDYEDYGRNNTHGLFNGGFVGATKDGISALEWWAYVCEKVCEKRRTKGYYVDQSHLNLIPILFENVSIIKNRGCNVASWNKNTSPRSIKDGKVFLNKKDELVFIHFTKDTIKGILNGQDPLLKPYLDEYERSLSAINPQREPFRKQKSIMERILKLFK